MIDSSDFRVKIRYQQYTGITFSIKIKDYFTDLIYIQDNNTPFENVHYKSRPNTYKLKTLGASGADNDLSYVKVYNMMVEWAIQFIEWAHGSSEWVAVKNADPVKYFTELDQQITARDKRIREAQDALIDHERKQSFKTLSNEGRTLIETEKDAKEFLKQLEVDSFHFQYINSYGKLSKRTFDIESKPPRTFYYHCGRRITLKQLIRDLIGTWV